MSPHDIKRRSSGPVLGVSICVIRGTRVLLTQRAQPPFEDKWSLPGGHVEAGEKLQEAALRELSEETGVKAELHDIFHVAEIIDSDGHFVIAVFRAAWTAGEPVAAGDAKAARWADLAELEEIELTPGLGHIVRKALSR
jgi:8-oxo-dGTP diphosphatase